MMNYIVAVHTHSAVGYAYAENQLRIRVGAETHVAFDCSDIDTSNPTYLYLKTLPNARGGSQQQLQLPHSAVLFIAHYEADGERPAGVELP